MKKKSTALAAVLATAVLITGCGSTSDSAASAGHDHADVAFATQMIPHHAQALQMADMTLGQKGVSTGLMTLADGVRRAQQPEIDQMEGWLKKWGEKVPQTGYGTGDQHSHHEGMAGMNGGSGDLHPKAGGMPGMMSGAQMSALARAHGPAFERMWLTMMIEHHQGAVTMARTELRAGRSAAAEGLARRVIAAQQTEIARMRTMLDRLG